MSTRAYRIVNIKLASYPSFNLSHDTELIEALRNGGEYNEDDAGTILDVGVDAIEHVLATFKFGSRDYRKRCLRRDLKFAKKHRKSYVSYSCF